MNMEEAREKLIVALDVPSQREALELCARLGGHVGAFKIGLQLFTSEGGEIVRRIVAEGHRVFLDLKFHDIPNTVASACVEAARLGVWMLNVHASGGSEMMRRAVDSVREDSDRRGADCPLMIAVTVLTSSDRATLNESGVTGDVDSQVERLTQLAMKAGLDGVVASALEVPRIKSVAEARHFLTVTPGIRPIQATLDDQRRVTTPMDAIRNGSDFLVVGRPITASPEPEQVAISIVEEISSAMRGQ
jgi:orotidine-5'-phosphate decarboxylase